MSAGARRFVYADDTKKEKPIELSLLTRLLRYMGPYRKEGAYALVYTLVQAAGRIGVPMLISLTIDRAIRPVDRPLLLMLTLAMLGAYLAVLVAQRLRIQMTNFIGQRVLYDLRTDLFRHLTRLSFDFYDRRPAGAILVRVTNDVNALQELFTNGVINVLMDTIMLVIILTVMFGLNWKLTLVAVIMLPLMILLTTKLRQAVRRNWRTHRVRLARLNAHLNEAIQGMRVTQAFGQERSNAAFFRQINGDYRQAWEVSARTGDAYNPILDVTGAVGLAAVWFVGAQLVAGEEITLGMLVAFAAYMQYFWDPVQRIGQIYNQLLQGMASAERIFEFMDTEPTVASATGDEPLSQIQGEVRFENVVFAYEPTRRALDGIDLRVAPGQTVALVGHTGSGKSTIISLLARFYDVTGGRVLVDGKDIREVEIGSLRSQIGFVLQDTFIFSGSVMENIRYGRLDATDNEVVAAAKLARAHDFIRHLPDGYETEVNERGSRLSMGQRQLIAFARAILADPRILILDEATANIDTETERLIQQGLSELLRGRTAFVVAHRLSTIRTADKIVVLDGGRVVEEGDHEELIRRRGYYRDLVEAQFH